MDGIAAKWKHLDKYQLMKVISFYEKINDYKVTEFYPSWYKNNYTSEDVVEFFENRYNSINILEDFFNEWRK